MRSTLPALVLLAGLLVACSDDSEPDAGRTPSSSSTSTAPPSSTPAETPIATPTATPTETPTEPADDLPPVTSAVSLPAIMREPLDGRGLRIVREVRADTDGHRKFEITYRSDDLTISGELFRPVGPGPFPAVVLNHGYIDPDDYVTGQGLAREQTWLADAGFVVLHTDYRGHAGSDDVPAVQLESRLGYTRDAANAVRVLRQQSYVDDDRIGMLGRSMGGGVTQNVLVAYPGLVDAAVVYASVSSDFVDNVEQFAARSRPAQVRSYYERYGTPEDNPAFYDGLSPRTYFDRITEPVLSLHGTADATCPPRWARTTDRLMRRAGVDSTLVYYEGEDHAFYDRWEDSIRRSVTFLQREL
jgi:dipeptidyl aminopeptidase/acylaminoacyl peptidase